jgi:hypothetical protein
MADKTKPSALQKVSATLYRRLTSPSPAGDLSEVATHESMGQEPCALPGSAVSSDVRRGACVMHPLMASGTTEYGISIPTRADPALQPLFLETVPEASESGGQSYTTHAPLQVHSEAGYHGADLRPPGRASTPPGSSSLRQSNSSLPWSGTGTLHSLLGARGNSVSPHSETGAHAGVSNLEPGSGGITSKLQAAAVEAVASLLESGAGSGQQHTNEADESQCIICYDREVRIIIYVYGIGLEN